jgi:hypothetical protein
MVSLCYYWNPKLLRTTSNVVSFGRNGISWKAAQFFAPFSERIFKATGWKLAGIAGLNWTTPLTESSWTRERTIWTGTFLPPSRQYVPGQTMMKIFRRPAVRIGRTAIDSKGHRTSMLRLQHRSRFTDHTRLNFGIEKHIMERCGLKHGQVIYPVVEIMLNGKPHPTPYARLPDVGPFSDWPNLNTMAIIIEYESESDGWKSIPLHNSQFFTVARPGTLGADSAAAPYLSAVYCRTSALIGGLMRYNYTGSLPPWAPKTSRFRVLDTFWDHYNQRIETSPAKAWDIAPIRLLSKVEVSQLLDARYRIKHNDGSETRLAMGVKPAGVFQGAGMGSGLERKLCDLCFIASVDAVHLFDPYLPILIILQHNLHDQDIFAPPTRNFAKPPQCTSAETGADTCVRCSRLNRPCTWTSRSDLIARGWTGLGVSRALFVQPRSIQPPESSQEMRELESNDDGDGGEDEDDVGDQDEEES